AGLGHRTTAIALHLPSDSVACALCPPANSDNVARLETLATDLPADFPFTDIVNAQLAQVAELAELSHMAFKGRVDLFARAKAQLQRLVAVALLGLDLDDGAGKRLDHGYRHGAAVRLEHLRHTDLAPQNAFDGHG